MQSKLSRQVSDSDIVKTKCKALEVENKELKSKFEETVSKQNYKDSLREIAVLKERVEVMEKYRKEMYNENLALYAKLQEKD